MGLVSGIECHWDFGIVVDWGWIQTIYSEVLNRKCYPMELWVYF